MEFRHIPQGAHNAIVRRAVRVGAHTYDSTGGTGELLPYPGKSDKEQLVIGKVQAGQAGRLFLIGQGDRASPGCKGLRQARVGDILAVGQLVISSVLARPRCDGDARRCRSIDIRCR